MKCQGCQIDSIKFYIRILDDTYIKMIVSQLQRRGFPISKQLDGILIVSEEAVHEVYDFCIDFELLHKVEFSTNNNEWRPLNEVKEILDVSWVDEVIRDERIICYSMPIVTANQQLFGYEVLARFTSSSGELLYPSEVFHAAKQRGRLYALDRTCRLAAVRYAQQLEGKVFINFIPTAIYDPQFCLRSTEMLAKQLNIEAKRFIFEVVETEQVEDVAHLKTILSYYREKGFQYALDDVGAGFSTIELLRDLSPHFMKLDRKFVDGVSTNKEAQLMAKKFLHAAKAINAVPLAEGVEQLEDFLYLKKVGYELFQGYLFGKPSPNPLVSFPIFRVHHTT